MCHSNRRISKQNFVFILSATESFFEMMVSESYSSESELSDDDKLTLLREAADPDLINDSMFQLTGKKTDDKGIASNSSKISIPFTQLAEQKMFSFKL